MEKRIRMIIKDTIVSRKGSFKIQEMKKEIIEKLNKKNIYNESNNKIINNYLDDLLLSRKLFNYSGSDEYFYIH